MDEARTWVLRLDADGPVPEPVCGAATLGAVTGLLGPGPVRWSVRVAAAMTAEVIERVPEHGGGAVPERTLGRAVEATVFLTLFGLLTDRSVSPLEVAPEAVEANAALVHRNISLDRVLRGVRIGHARLHRELMAAIEREPEPVRSAESHRVSEALFEYADVQASRLAEEYIAERDRWQAGTEAARRAVVEDLLAARRVTADRAARVLGCSLDRHHLALIVWTDDADGRAADLARYAGAFARDTGAEQSLTVRDGPSALWAWAGWATRPSDDLLARALREPPPGIRVAAGPVASGQEGFRRSHLGARAAERIALRIGDRVRAYPEVSVEVLATADVEEARWYVAEVLGELADPGPRAAELRETLRVYLEQGRSPALAAELLSVSRNTVTYRVRRAEELLGRPVGVGHEVWLALRAATALPPGGPSTP
ncbi:DNA-binding PucR family transcriptional regulator [Actinocorallia herbida]|uniref:DNA-binding PucR family transcriptional regulator n=1 Tax=Actinocorallia herbida TaxID=58109 RepID=A0A3N1CZY3_9ACTN|nr:DNA-binding PucR family transcriptional regulator [Actinocorallia herbida]